MSGTNLPIRRNFCHTVCFEIECRLEFTESYAINKIYPPQRKQGRCTERAGLKKSSFMSHNSQGIRVCNYFPCKITYLKNVSSFSILDYFLCCTFKFVQFKQTFWWCKSNNSNLMIIYICVAHKTCMQTVVEGAIKTVLNKRAIHSCIGWLRHAFHVNTFSTS